jgi:SAM-dependent methyltransferase
LEKTISYNTLSNSHLISSKVEHSKLIEQYLPLIKQLQHQPSLNDKFEVLDLACGNGRNGLYLLKNNISVCFADINADALTLVNDQVKQTGSDILTPKYNANFWNVDFEQEGTQPLQGKQYAGVSVFRYLHRPLFEQLKDAVLPGGFVIYETFNVDNAEFGRPKNPKFLLNKDELLNLFSGWKIIHHFEGVVTTIDKSAKQAISQIVALKPNK